MKEKEIEPEKLPNIEPQLKPLRNLKLDRVKTTVKQKCDIVRLCKSKGTTNTYALAKAGYARPQTAIGNAPQSVKQAIIDGEAVFRERYLRQCKRVELTPDKIADRLAKTIHGDDDFNSTHAINTHLKIIFKPKEKGSGIPVGNVFIVPMRVQDAEFAGLASAVEAEIIP